MKKMQMSRFISAKLESELESDSESDSETGEICYWINDKGKI